ncbi:TPR repeat-containing protein [Allocoleopsis franciscana PCC 7113]|uniref:TPR repeat-containing protein n=2 Tax=Allocoleopsis TaxID=2886347 RepID=K9WHE0_9CYAN|nr:TPR repeat-containing protein [Allocoleopsis franciscana PCC 7113]
MSAEVLEAIFVQRQELAHNLIECIRDRILASARHHTLLTGARGIGKTHLVSLVYHRIRDMKDLQEHILIAWLSEEEWSVTSFLDLLLCVFQALQEESKNSKGTQPCLPTERVESLYELPIEDAESDGAALLKEFIGDRTLLLLVENLDDLFSGLGKDGQKQLCTFLEENNCIILATAQSYFKDVKQKNAPFYGFFRHEELKDLNTSEATQLLANIAKLKGNSALESFIQTPTGRDRIKAVHFLAGGNHRLYVIFSEFLTHQESLDQLVDAFMRTLDDLTPYYQERMRFLSPQQRKIVDFLCDRRQAVTVKEIAQRCFMTHQTASSQLKKVLEMGYVRSEPIGRESYYELREPLMRFCLEVKKQRGEPVRLFVDFLRIWYTRTDLEQRLGRLPPNAKLEREYLLHALRETEEEAEEIVEICLEDYYAYLEEENFAQALQIAQELVAIRGHIEDWLEQGYCLGVLGRIEEALASFSKAIKLDPNEPIAWFNRGIALRCLERYEEALASFNKGLELNPNESITWRNRGATLGNLGRHEDALISYDKAIELEPANANALINRGAALGNLGRYEEALVSYDKAIELDPTNANALINQGVVFSKLRRYNEALVCADKAIELDPNYGLVWNYQGWVLGQLERYDEALTSYDKAIELDPTDADGWFNRGWLLGELGSYDEGLESCDKAIELGEQSSFVFLNRAEYLLALNRWEDGIAALDKALHRFAHADEPDTGDEKAIIRNLFKSTHDASIWRSRISTLIELYDKHQVISALGQGLVRSIPELMSEMVSDKARQTWLEVWQELTSDRTQFQLPLRLLNIAVRYRETKGDKRVLLQLPIEERNLLKPLLRIDQP